MKTQVSVDLPLQDRRLDKLKKIHTVDLQCFIFIAT